MPNQSDDRGIWPSASAAEANHLCPGRHLAQLGIPEEPQTPDAESGTVIHDAWANRPRRPLTHDEQESLEALRSRSDEIFRQWNPNPAGYKAGLIASIEKRLWHNSCGMKCSGQVDRFYIIGYRALIIDGKRGRKVVTTEPTNRQLRWLAALVAINYPGVTEVTVALAQHWAPKTAPCVYDINALSEALQQMEEDVGACYAPDVKRIAGPVQCEYCRAKKNCPEFLASGLPVPYEPQPASQTQVQDAVSALPGPRLGLLLSMSRLVVEVAESECRKRLADGSAVDGWKMSPGRTMEKIVDPQTLFERFILAGGKTEQFLPAVTVQKGKFKDALRGVAGLKGKALDSRLAEMLDGLTESKTGNPVLEHE